jgi:integrase
MSVSKMPSGRWRAQVYDRTTRKNISVHRVIGGEKSFRTKTEAKQARARAREKLASWGGGTVTVREWSERWLEDPLFHETAGRRIKESTLVNRRQSLKPFVELFGDLPLDRVDDQVVARYLKGGKRNYTVSDLRRMFTDATSAKAGRLISENPFAGLGISKPKGNRGKQPPTELEFSKLVASAWRLTPPMFAGWFEFACYSGLRPGEIDALEPDDIDVAAGVINIRRQFNTATRTFTTPKYGPYKAALTDPAAELLSRIPKSKSRWVFETLRHNHFTITSRTHHWNRVRCDVGIAETSLYLATRHYFGWYALNVLGLEPAVIALQLGHRDGGKLVEELYGHRELRRAHQQIRAAFTSNVVPLRRPKAEGGEA